MAEWKFTDDDFLIPLDSKFEDIQTLFLSGKITKMYQLVERSPTKVAQLLGLNYDSYHDKLSNPEKFTSLHINIMAYAFRINPDIIHNVIQKQILDKVINKIKKHYLNNNHH